MKATRTGTEGPGTAWARFKIAPVSVSIPIYCLESSPELPRGRFHGELTWAVRRPLSQSYCMTRLSDASLKIKVRLHL